MRSSHGRGDPANVDSEIGGNDFTHRKLFHLHIGNCFISCRLLIEITFGRAPEFVSIGYFCGHLVTIALLIEIFHMVPFPPIVLNEVSVYIGHASGHAPLTVHRAGFKPDVYRLPYGTAVVCRAKSVQ